MVEFVLREWQITDVNSVANSANSKKIADNLRNVFPYPYTVKDAQIYIESCIENEGKNQICRAIVVDGKAVGSIGVFVGGDIYCKCGEIGYWLDEKYWGQGVMTKAIKQMCETAFKQFNLCRIYAEPYAHNVGSRRALEKAGFMLEGVMKKGAFKDGNVFDWCMYGLTI